MKMMEYRVEVVTTIAAPFLLQPTNSNNFRSPQKTLVEIMTSYSMSYLACTLNKFLKKMISDKTF